MPSRTTENAQQDLPSRPAGVARDALPHVSTVAFPLHAALGHRHTSGSSSCRYLSTPKYKIRANKSRPSGSRLIPASTLPFLPPGPLKTCTIQIRPRQSQSQEQDLDSRGETLHYAHRGAGAACAASGSTTSAQPLPPCASQHPAFTKLLLTLPWQRGPRYLAETDFSHPGTAREAARGGSGREQARRKARRRLPADEQLDNPRGWSSW